MTVEEALKKSGTKSALKGAIKKTKNAIKENEEILYAINTNVSIEYINQSIMKTTPNMSFMSMKNKLSGIITITNERILFISSILGNINEKQMLIKDITSIDGSINGLFRMGQIRIRGITEMFIIDIYRKNIYDEIKNIIYLQQENIKKGNNINSASISNADEIRKYKQLLDEGIITQQEFENKKKELLK